MNNYCQVVYGSYKPSTFDGKLVGYLVKKYGWKKGQAVLDVGCGTGKYMREFAAHEFIPAGVDIDTCNFEQKIPVADNSCQYIFCKSVIEHIQNADKFISELYRILKPGGQIVILTPAWEYNYKWFYDDYTHIKPYYRKGLQDALRIHNFKKVNVEYMYYLPFVWKHKWLEIVPKIIDKITSNKDRWKDKEETQANNLVRFSKEIQLIGVGTK